MFQTGSSDSRHGVGKTGVELAANRIVSATHMHSRDPLMLFGRTKYSWPAGICINSGLAGLPSGSTCLPSIGLDGVTDPTSCLELICQWHLQHFV